MISVRNLTQCSGIQLRAAATMSKLRFSYPLRWRSGFAPLSRSWLSRAPAIRSAASRQSSRGTVGLAVTISLAETLKRPASYCKMAAPGAGWSPSEDEALMGVDDGCDGNRAGSAKAPVAAEELVLAPVVFRCIAALLDGLLLLSLSAIALVSGLRGRVAFNGIDWESFYYVWLHLPTLCTVSVRQRSASDSSSTSSRWPIYCDISPTAFLLHLYFEVVRAATTMARM